MIHELSIDGESDPKNVAKLARKFAMTGGVRFSLSAELAASDLEVLVARFLPEALALDPKSKTFETSHAYRILELIAQSHDCPPALQKRISQEVFEQRRQQSSLAFYEYSKEKR